MAGKLATRQDLESLAELTGGYIINPATNQARMFLDFTLPEIETVKVRFDLTGILEHRNKMFFARGDDWTHAAPASDFASRCIHLTGRGSRSSEAYLAAQGYFGLLFPNADLY